jgi:hypothetical protein
MDGRQFEHATLRPFASTSWHLGAAAHGTAPSGSASTRDGSRKPVMAFLGGSGSSKPSSKSSSSNQPRGSAGNGRAWFNFTPRAAGFGLGAGGGAAAWVSTILLGY